MSNAAGTATGLVVVSASAGTGKTTRLTNLVCSNLDPTTPNAISVPGLFAVTYTTKAQAELESRLRQTLVQRGELERAEQLPLAHMGTVHAVCLRLLQEFALEAGLSPGLVGMPAQAARHSLQQALERGLDPELRERVNRLAGALELRWDGRVARYDWITPVDQIMTLARNNRVAPEELPRMAARSSAGLLALLGPPLVDGDALEREVLESANDTLTALEAFGSSKKNTGEAIDELRSAVAALQKHELPWSGWAKLARLEPEKKALPLVARVRTVASQYEVHPRFQHELRELCSAVFDAARVGLDAYAEFKRARGLVDFVDMIDLGLEVLSLPDVENVLRDRVELCVVDEFQDTSPVQLALFSRLHALSGRAFWVGDQKQCIFEYAGADPGLMDAVHDWVNAHGGKTDLLAKNYRSRPELVRPISTLFVGAFASHGLAPEEVACEPARPALPELDELPAFGMFRFASKRDDTPSIAQGVERLLAAPHETPVLDRRTQTTRPLRPSDVAILVATNNEAEKLSQALAERGIRAVLPRTGLMKTPEATLLRAALRFLTDPRDSLALAEIEALHGFDGRALGDWLEKRLATVSIDAGPQAAFPANGVVARLEGARATLSHLSPSELVERVVAALDLTTVTRRWPDPEQRLGNIDALKALTRAYENRATYLREAASTGGLLRYFADAELKVQQQDEERASDEQHVGAAGDAVVLSTYHKAKGLEWPVVVLGSLDRDRRRDAFDVTPEADNDSFDPANPLGGRWIRYWPWPLGQLKKAPLKDRAEDTAVGRRIAQRDARERVRLLYVGFTRARDHLILAVGTDAKGKPKTAWLDEMADKEGPLLELPADDQRTPELTVRTHEGERLRVPVRDWTSNSAAPVPAPPKRSEECAWFSPAGHLVHGERYWIQPSKAAESGLELPAARVVRVERFAGRIPIGCPPHNPWDEVGTALHRFLAADLPERGHSGRRLVAERVLTDSALGDSFSADSLLAASDAFRGFADARWPHALWHRELPISAVLSSPQGERRIQGSIDLLLQTEQGVVLIDHKSFPGKSDAWGEKALGYASQLMAYSRALSIAGQTVLGCFVHFTIGGGIVELGLE